MARTRIPPVVFPVLSVVRRRYPAVAALGLTAGLLVSSWAAPGQKKPVVRSGGIAPAAGSLALLSGSGKLDGSYGFQTLSVVLTRPDGSALEVTDRAVITSSHPAVVKVDNGAALPVGDGEAEVVARYQGLTARAKLSVKNSRTDANLDFENHVTPILIKHGCNGTACHGAPNGQGGLKFSFFGYDADKDREAVWSADKGRRINASDPASSMIALKPANVIPHQGGKRFAKGGPEYRTLIAWVKAGGPLLPRSMSRGAASSTPAVRLASTSPAPPSTAVSPGSALESISVMPAERTVRDASSRHQLIVTATFADGSTRDVTPFARFISDDEGVISTSSSGKVTALRNGESNIMVRYHGKATVSRFYSLLKPRPAKYPKAQAANFIDTHVFAKLKKLGIVPSELTTDAQFIRRVSLDIAGILPTAAQVRSFVADKDPGKRSRLIDTLLERPEYQDVMTIQWSELLRINRLFLQEEGVKRYTAFVRDSIADNKPFDQFVREIIGSAYHPRDAVEASREKQTRADQAVYRESSGYHNGPVNYYRVTADPTELTTSTSQIFLGVRMDCARCHNHPFDRWSMDDFYGLAAYFAGTAYTGGKVRDEVAIYTDNNGLIRNPRTNKVVLPKPLNAPLPDKSALEDRHRKLAAWITSKDNPFFAKATVNRFWKHFFGRGIVHPVDDFRATNPPVNEPLMDALAKEFIDHNFDVKHLIRTICNSRTYQLSDKSNATNEGDYKNFSHFYSKRLGPEVLFDAIVTATGVPENFGRANAVRATNLPDNSVPSYFLDVFGRSRRVQVAERSDDTSMSQALHLMNGGTINDRIANPKGTVARLVNTSLKPADAIEEIYLACLSRWPTEKEVKAALYYLQNASSVREGYEDLMWAILNSREFIFNH